MITANDLKVKGIKAIEKELEERDEAIISFRGKPKYIVLDIEEYDRIRALELDLLYLQAQEEIKSGKAMRVNSQEELEEGPFKTPCQVSISNTFLVVTPPT